MPIKTSHGQLTPFRRGGYRLYFLSLAKPACRQTYLSAPADRTQSRNWSNSPLTKGLGACPAELREDSLIFSRKGAKTQRNLTAHYLPTGILILKVLST